MDSEGGNLISARSGAVGGNSGNSGNNDKEPRKEKWTPCDDNGNIMTEKPDKPQTKFNKCLANKGFGYDVIRCSNWQRNGEMSNPQNDDAEACMFKCNDLINQFANLQEALYNCNN